MAMQEAELKESQHRHDTYTGLLGRPSEVHPKWESGRKGIEIEIGYCAPPLSRGT